MSTKNYEQSIKVPPHNNEAEMSILGAILIDDHSIKKILGIIEPEDFYGPGHGTIFSAMLDLREGIDPITVINRLKQREDLETCGGECYISSLLNGCPTAVNIEYHAKIIKQYALLRKLIETGERTVHDGYQFDADLDELLSKNSQTINAIQADVSGSTFESIKSITLRRLDEIEALYKNPEQAKRNYYLTPFPTLDDKFITGLFPKQMVVIAGRPSTGKTTLAINFIWTLARAGLPIAFFSFDTTKDRVYDRLASMITGFSTGKIVTASLNVSENIELIEASREMAKLPLEIYEQVLTIEQLRGKTEQLVSRRKIKVVVIDYIQQILGDQRIKNREERVSINSAGIKRMAKELDIVAIVCSQLHREIEKRSPKDRKPKLSDIRESGAIEQDADIVLAPYTDPTERETTGGISPVSTEMLVLKCKDGATGSFPVKWLPSCYRFYEPDMENH